MRLIDADRLKRQVEGRSWRAKNKMVELIDNSPTIEAEPVKHGRWETDGMPMDDGEYLVTRCTACGMAYEHGHNENYCGFCGAKMDGEQDG